jgi:hypothetical protein
MMDKVKPVSEENVGKSSRQRIKEVFVNVDEGWEYTFDTFDSDRKDGQGRVNLENKLFAVGDSGELLGVFPDITTGDKIANYLNGLTEGYIDAPLWSNFGAGLNDTFLGCEATLADYILAVKEERIDPRIVERMPVSEAIKAMEIVAEKAKNHNFWAKMGIGEGGSCERVTKAVKEEVKDLLAKAELSYFPEQ